jgi:hypothetical protein
MAVHGHDVNQQNKGREVDKEPQFISAQETTTTLGDMSAEIVKRCRQAQNVEDLSNQDTFSVEGKDGGAATQDWNI